MGKIDDDYEEILKQIDTTLPPPEREPERQYYYMAKLREIVRQKSQELGRPLFSTIKTFGCQMNLKIEIAL